MKFTATLIIILLMLISQIFAQTPGDDLTDYDGNVYKTVIIGNQTWMAENLKSSHYCDGSEIPDVVAYNNDQNLADVYGLLYTWNATMNGSNVAGSQGACPCEWHVPSDEEWIELENYLGGANIAGGKMKETGLDHWSAPNTGADNSSGLTILPAGEYDTGLNPPDFNLINDYAVFWTSTQVNALKARERYLAFNDAKSSTLDWFKSLKYSIRCVKNVPTSDVNIDKSVPLSFQLNQNYPNPFNPTTTFEYSIPADENIKISLYDILGKKITELYNGIQKAGVHRLSINGENLVSGMYFYELSSSDNVMTRKCFLVK